MINRIDMHMHTTCSDGKHTPLEIVMMCKEAQLSGFSITDHDTFSAYSKELFTAAKEASLECITGMELSTLFNGESIHLLVYNFPLDGSIVKEICKRQRAKREERNKQILFNLGKNHQFKIEMEDIYLESRDTVGRVHIAEKMLELGYIETMKEAFDTYIGDGKPCHAIVDYISLQDAVICLKESGAFVSLAHPHVYKQSICRKIWDAGIEFNGIECFWKWAPRWQCNKFVEIAKKRGFQITGGSDFHGLKSEEWLGSSYVEQFPQSIKFS